MRRDSELCIVSELIKFQYLRITKHYRILNEDYCDFLRELHCCSEGLSLCLLLGFIFLSSRKCGMPPLESKRLFFMFPF